MEFINLTERAGVPRTTNSVVANDPGAVCVTGAGKSAGVVVTPKRLPLCVHASACLLPAIVALVYVLRVYIMFWKSVHNCVF